MSVSAGSVTIALLLPTLNEIEGLKWALQRIDRSLFDDIIVIDGGSTDGTLEFARESGLTTVIQSRPGLHFAIFDVVHEIDFDYVVEFSPDGNCMPEKLPELVRRLHDGADLVVVSRYLGHARSHDDNMVSAFGNWFFTRLIDWLGKSKITDSLNIYRGFKREIALSSEFERLLVGPVFEPLVTGVCQLQGLEVGEIPGDEPPRIGGETKRSIIF